jgi:ubiquitin C-terminal hydrolase
MNTFIDTIAPKFQLAEWRKNTLADWKMESKRKKKKYYCGIENLSATCYMNCLFQQLFMNKTFLNQFININSLNYK